MKRFASYLDKLQYHKKLTRVQLFIAIAGILLFLALALTIPNYLLRHQQFLRGQAQTALALPPAPALPDTALPPSPITPSATPLPPTNSPVPPTPTNTPVPPAPTNTPVPPTPTSAIDTVKPTVSITSPANASFVKRKTNILVQASASDNKAVTKVEFRRNGALVCTDTTVPYSCATYTDNAPNKTVTYSAQAFDAAGNTATHTISVITQ